MQIRVQRLPHAEGLPLPQAATHGAAGSDLRAAISEPFVLEAGAHAAIPTGFCFELPPGTEAQVRPRSGLARRHGVTVLNSPGTVDCDFRGEIQILLINHGREALTIQRGDRIAQMVLARLVDFDFAEVEELGDTERGAGGWGSSGLS